MTTLKESVPEFSYPINPIEAYKFPNVDAKFLDPNYKGNHQAIDINGKGGGNTDLGATVHNMFSGHVVYKGALRGTGNIIRVRSLEWIRAYFENKLRLELKNKAFKLETLDMLYMHLQYTQHIKIGQAVGSGQVIGTIGTGKTGLNWWQKFTKGYTAHLHLEAIKVIHDGYMPQHSRTRADILKTHFDPMLLFKVAKFSNEPNLLPEFKGLVAPIRLLYKNNKILERELELKVSHINGKLYINS